MWKGASQPDVNYCAIFCPEELRKTTKFIIQHRMLIAEIRSRDVPKTKQSSLQSLYYSWFYFLSKGSGTICRRFYILLVWREGDCISVGPGTPEVYENTVPKSPQINHRLISETDQCNYIICFIVHLILNVLNPTCFDPFRGHYKGLT